MSIRNLQVKPVTFRNVVVGYRVEGIARDCADSLWDPIFHRVVFRDKARAERLLARVRAVMPWDLKMSEWCTGYTWEGVYTAL